MMSLSSLIQGGVLFEGCNWVVYFLKNKLEKLSIFQIKMTQDNLRV